MKSLPEIPFLLAKGLDAMTLSPQRGNIGPIVVTGTDAFPDTETWGF